jgi:hypothetical protein
MLGAVVSVSSEPLSEGNAFILALLILVQDGFIYSGKVDRPILQVSL